MAEEQLVGNGEQGKQSGEEDRKSETQNWDAWLATQPETVKALVDEHVKGLKNALAAEREQRKMLANELREALAKAEKKSELERSLSEITSRVEAAEKRAKFFEMASQPGIGCVNAKAAYLVAQAEGLFKQDGSPDWAALQTIAPELFRKAGMMGNAGAGTGTIPPVKMTMNEFIRRTAGRR